MVAAASAEADFPYGIGGPAYHLAPGSVPNDLSGDGNDWKFAATPDPSNPNLQASTPFELNGVRGAHVVDPSPVVATAWQTTTGHPDVTIAVLDSGIKWNDLGNILDLRDKVRLNKGELPVPNHSRSAPVDPTVTKPCSTYTNSYDANGDGVFNVLDYACDSRVSANPPGAASVSYPSYWKHPAAAAGKPVLTPEDLIIAFSDGTDQDHNGFVDDIAGWDFLDNDNDPYDDVQYGHGTGEALDSSSEANNRFDETNPSKPAGKQGESYADQTGACPNCSVMPLRVGDSFVADVNNFAQATLYAVDSGALVVQEALGTLNQSPIARHAVDYAYNHGVAVIASAADEAAQHHNWPSNYAHTIVVNSVAKEDTNPAGTSYVAFNGCTNFSTKVTLAIPSSSCSSNATGLAAGFAGLIYSAAEDAHAANKLSANTSCKRVSGANCLLTANEVRQLMASGSVGGTPVADDINFAASEPSCSPTPAPGCTDPNGVPTARNPISPSGPPTSRSYPARKGYDEFYGYGRADIAHGAAAAALGTIPPEAEITGPDWYTPVDPAKSSVSISGQVFDRGRQYTCKVYVAPGSEPNNALTTDSPAGDFKQVSSSWCDGSARTTRFSGVLSQLDLNALKSRFPPGTSFTGAAPSPLANAPNFNNRPHPEPVGFTVRVVVTDSTTPGLTGQDRRNFFLHHDSDLLPGFPRNLVTDGESPPVLADLNGDNRAEVIFGGSDGFVHAMRRDGTELPGWPVRTDSLPLHTGERAYSSHEISTNAGNALINSVAVGDIDHDGLPEVVGADMGGKIYVWRNNGKLLWKREANPRYSGKPLSPFHNVRQGVRYRTQHGFLASPVLANLDHADGLDVVVAGMDRHVYSFDKSGKLLSGFPVLLVDRSKISAVDPTTHAPTFNSSAGDPLNQGAIVDTPAVADVNGDHRPEIIVGTNEEYLANSDGGFNAGNLNTASLSVLQNDPTGTLSFGNSRVYALKATGEPGGPKPGDNSAFLAGWPKKVGTIFTELLPVVGEGVDSPPVVGPGTCSTGGSGLKVGAMADAGPAYVFNPDGSSCYSQSNGHDNALQTDFAAGAGKYDTPAIPAVGNLAFGNLGGTGPSLLAPAAGVLRALDLGLKEYQGGQDFTAAWNVETGQFRPGFPAPDNDLQFLTGPVVADIGGAPGEEAVNGTASLDFNAFTGAGAQSSGWPKFSTDWTVATPAIGSLGTLDSDASARKVVVAMTRSGLLFAYATTAPACAAGSWPRYHHDPANSGDYTRDAVDPGRPYSPTFSKGVLSFRAPGDDLMCGKVNHYDLVESSHPLSGATFDQGYPVPSDSLNKSIADPGGQQKLALGGKLLRYLSIRAVDDQGNVGPIAELRTKPGPAGPCGDRTRPESKIVRAWTKLSTKGVTIKGRANDHGCTKLSQAKRLNAIVVSISIARSLGHGKCSFLQRDGRFSARRSCSRAIYLKTRGKYSAKFHRLVWLYKKKVKLKPGTYVVTDHAVDQSGNVEIKVTKRNRKVIRVRRHHRH